MTAPLSEFSALLARYPVVIFLRGHPEAPSCGFSMLTAQILDHIGVEFYGVDALEETDMLAALKQELGPETELPQMFVRGRHIGGCNEVRRLFESGELQTFFIAEDLVAS